jgi:hypothetical protein
MGMTQEDRRSLKGNVAMEPLAVRPSEAARLIGSGRSVVYRLMASGELLAVKRGAATLVLMVSIREHLAGLPPATFGADRAATR